MRRAWRPCGAIQVKKSKQNVLGQNRITEGVTKPVAARARAEVSICAAECVAIHAGGDGGRRVGGGAGAGGEGDWRGANRAWRKCKRPGGGGARDAALPFAAGENCGAEFGGGNFGEADAPGAGPG